MGRKLQAFVHAELEPVAEECEVRLDGIVTWAIKAPPHMKDSLEHGMGVQFLDVPRSWLAVFSAWRESVGAEAPF